MNVYRHLTGGCVFVFLLLSAHFGNLAHGQFANFNAVTQGVDSSSGGASNWQGHSQIGYAIGVHFDNTYSGGPGDPPTIFFVEVILENESGDEVSRSVNLYNLNWCQQQDVAVGGFVSTSLLGSFTNVVGTINIGTVDSNGNYNILDQDTTSLWWINGD